MAATLQVHPQRHQHRTRLDHSVLAHLLVARPRLRTDRALPAAVAQTPAASYPDSGPGSRQCPLHAMPEQLFRDRHHLALGYSLEVHLRHGRLQRLLGPLVALEYARRESPLAAVEHAQFDAPCSGTPRRVCCRPPARVRHRCLSTPSHSPKPSVTAQSWQPPHKCTNTSAIPITLYSWRKVAGRQESCEPRTQSHGASANWRYG